MIAAAAAAATDHAAGAAGLTTSPPLKPACAQVQTAALALSIVTLTLIAMVTWMVTIWMTYGACQTPAVLHLMLTYGQ